MDWKFQDPQNAAVITNKKIIQSGDWIAYVTHDAEDGGWQFHNREPLGENAAVVMSLRSIFDIDPTIGELANLPLGWHAWRESRSAPWQRSQM